MRYLRWKWRLDDGEAAARAVVSPPAASPGSLPAAAPVEFASYRTTMIGLRLTTPYGPADFVDGVFSTSDPEVILNLDGFASRRPDLVAKEA